MISRSAPYPLFRRVCDCFTSCHEKEHRKNISLITTRCQRDNGRSRLIFRALRLAVVVLSIACSSQLAAANERFSHLFGQFETLSTRQGIIIAAPHGTYDIHTDALAENVARTLGVGYVIARGFSPGSSRINVNRPTEGAGCSCERERRTERAADVYNHYVRLIGKSVDGKALRLYVEIHGHTNILFPNRMEIAATGISMEEARQLKGRFPAFLAQAKAVYPAYPELELRMEPLDKVFFGARCDKTIGSISVLKMDRALHIEVPRSARTPEAMKATAELIGSMVRAIMLSTGPASGPEGKEG